MQFYFRPYVVLVLAAILLCAPDTQAQTTDKPKSYPTPIWIKAMNDTAANYYAAQRDYEAFWKGKEKPEDEEHLMNKGTEQTKESVKKLNKKEMKEAREMDYYRYQCKRFENWLRVNKPYVQKDGHILTADERLKLWQENQKSRQ